jgi:hypothetical protein
MTQILRIIRWSACVAGALLLLPTARADVTYSKSDDDLTIVRMNVTPAAEPVPALKYRLLVRDIDLKSGNAASFYYRAFLQLPNGMKHLRQKFDEDEQLGKWYGTGVDATPIDELPLDSLREASRFIDGLIRDFLSVAVEQRDCNWQLDVGDIRGVDVIAFQLPEFQESREVCRMLALRTRLAIAEQRYGDAAETMQIDYRLARDVASVPFLVNGLIGIAEAGVANGTIIDWIGQPNSPNLYWAIAELPNPLIDLRPAARFEMDFGPRMFPFIHNAETTDHSSAEWNRLYTQSMRGLATIGDGSIPARSELGAGLSATAFALIGYPYAKARLIADGMEPDRVNSMAVGQVMAVYTERNYLQFANDYEKIWYVPFWDMRRQSEAVQRRLREADLRKGGLDREVLPIVSLLMPAVEACRAAQVRLERDIAALRIIEALRMYAASHAGGLPKSLDEITEVPVPLNPATGKPFVYRLNGQTAILDLPASDDIPGSNRRFEISIAKSK